MALYRLFSVGTLARFIIGGWWWNGTSCSDGSVEVTRDVSNFESGSGRYGLNIITFQLACALPKLFW